MEWNWNNGNIILAVDGFLELFKHFRINRTGVLQLVKSYVWHSQLTRDHRIPHFSDTTSTRGSNMKSNNPSWASKSHIVCELKVANQSPDHMYILQVECQSLSQTMEQVLLLDRVHLLPTLSVAVPRSSWLLQPRWKSLEWRFQTWRVERLSEMLISSLNV